MYELDDLKEIDSCEAESLNGCVILGAVGTGLGILGGVCLLAYGAGYVYGKLTCDCNK